MTWLVYHIDADHTGIEFAAFRTPEMRTVSEHQTIEEARQALVDYRAAEARERAVNQLDLFGGSHD